MRSEQSLVAQVGRGGPGAAGARLGSRRFLRRELEPGDTSTRGAARPDAPRLLAEATTPLRPSCRHAEGVDVSSLWTCDCAVHAAALLASTVGAACRPQGSLSNTVEAGYSYAAPGTLISEACHEHLTDWCILSRLCSCDREQAPTVVFQFCMISTRNALANHAHSSVKPSSASIKAPVNL
jgi:hypothetical protein